MKKYEELENNIYVKEVGNLVTLLDAAKMLGISSKELKKFVISEQMESNKLIKDLLDKMFGANIIPEIQQSYYLDLLENNSKLGYFISVLTSSFPNLKNNPKLLFQALTEYDLNQIKEFDKVEVSQEDAKNSFLAGYVSNFASDYGISSRKMYNFIIEKQMNNQSVFNKMLDTYKTANYDKVASNNMLKNLKKVSNLDYIVASLIYNFPNFTKNSDTFFSAIIESKDNEFEKADLSEIEDANIKKFIESKSNYYIADKVK